MSEMNLDIMKELDWIKVTDLKDEDHPYGEMEVINVAEVLVGEEAGLYIMAIYPDDEEIPDEDEEELEIDEEIETFLFRVVDKENAEYEVTDEADNTFYVSADFTDEEFEIVSNLFIETTEEYEVSIEDNEEE